MSTPHYAPCLAWDPANQEGEGWTSGQVHKERAPRWNLWSVGRDCHRAVDFGGDSRYVPELKILGSP